MCLGVLGQPARRLETLGLRDVRGVAVSAPSPGIKSGRVYGNLAPARPGCLWRFHNSLACSRGGTGFRDGFVASIRHTPFGTFPATLFLLRTTVMLVNILSTTTPSDAPASRGPWMVWAATSISWVIGFASIFLVAPTNSGVGVMEAYALFQPGSNFGNALAFLCWSGAALITGWLQSRRPGRILIRMAIAFGVPAVFSLFPAAVVSNAIAHAVAVEDGFVYHDWLAGPLVVSGVVALSIAFISGLIARR